MSIIDLEYFPVDQREEMMETNAFRISRNEEILGPCLDANQIEDYDNFREENVLDYNGMVIGVKSELPRRRYRNDD